MVEIVIYTPEKLVFQGQAESIIFPGEQGVFEVLSYHKPFVSRLISGTIVVGEQSYPLRCGIVAINHNKATAVIEQ